MGDLFAGQQGIQTPSLEACKGESASLTSKNLRESIRRRLQNTDIQSEIKEIIVSIGKGTYRGEKNTSEQKEKEWNTDGPTNATGFRKGSAAKVETIVEVLKQRGVIERVVRSLELRKMIEENIDQEIEKWKHEGPEAIVEDSDCVQKQEQNRVPLNGLQDASTSALDPCVKIYLGKGRCFLDALGVSAKNGKLEVYIYHNDSVIAIPCVHLSTDPIFNVDVTLPLRQQGIHPINEPTEHEPLRMIFVLHIRGQVEKRRVVSEYRRRLSTGKYMCNLETVALEGVGNERATCAGLLDMTVDVISNGMLKPAPSTKEKQMSSLRQRHFARSVSLWLEDYLHIRESHRQRCVKVFATDSTTGSRIPVGNFLCKIKSTVFFDTPLIAARFVSLFGKNSNALRNSAYSSNLVQQSQDASRHLTHVKHEWAPLSTFISQRWGDDKSHSLLLCSLLLGFGQNAFVTMGIKKGIGLYSWVTTILEDQTVMFWDSMNGKQYLQRYKRGAQPIREHCHTHPFITIDCLFNQHCLLANCQPSNCSSLCNFELGNPGLWKKISFESDEGLWGLSFTNPMEPPNTAHDIQLELMGQIEVHRRSANLACTWNNSLRESMGRVLALLEEQKRTSLVSNFTQYREMIKDNVPESHVFKAFPINVNSSSALEIFAECLKNPAFNEVMMASGDSVRLCVVALIFPYPQSLFSTWVMVSATYTTVL
eukprot:Nk52_evm14s352 gene=Nk52_evmTU14s352